MAEERPELVRRFIQALLKGWEAALDPANDDPVLAMLQEFDKDTPPDQLQAQLAVTRKLVKPSDDAPIGTIDIEAWVQTEQIMLHQNQIAEPVNVTSVLRPAFALNP
jgi:NitT/TauT family transport system substrate-binding protein